MDQNLADPWEIGRLLKDIRRRANFWYWIFLLLDLVSLCLPPTPTLTPFYGTMKRAGRQKDLKWVPKKMQWVPWVSWTLLGNPEPGTPPPHRHFHPLSWGKKESIWILRVLDATGESGDLKSGRWLSCQCESHHGDLVTTDHKQARSSQLPGALHVSSSYLLPGCSINLPCLYWPPLLFNSCVVTALIRVLTHRVAAI